MTDYATPGALVSAEWAQQHLGDPASASSRWTLTPPPTSRATCPGAVGWNWTSQLSDGIRRDIASREDLAALLSELGHRTRTRTSCSTATTTTGSRRGPTGSSSCTAWPRVSILNGGRKYWVDNGLPVTTDVPSYAATTGSRYRSPTSRCAPSATTSCPRLGDPGLTLVDVRSPAEFNGEVIAPPGHDRDRAAGGPHPGRAVSTRGRRRCNEDGTFKDADDLRGLYAPKGVTADKDVIAYCRIGERSSHSWFVLHELLGYPRVRNYDGSWTEWGSLINVPIEKSVAVPA